MLRVDAVVIVSLLGSFPIQLLERRLILVELRSPKCSRRSMRIADHVRLLMSLVWEIVLAVEWGAFDSFGLEGSLE